MPCGGIYPISGTSHHPCWYCGKSGADLILIEWDSVIHSACVPAFLKTEEGDIVLSHKHEVTIMENGLRRTLHEEQ